MAKTLLDLLRSQEGVTSASASTVTGSLVVTYDVSVTDGMEILRRLKAAGYEVHRGNDTLGRSLPGALSAQVGERILKSLVETRGGNARRLP